VDLRIPERLRRYLGGGGGEFGRRPRESSFRADEFAAKDARARDDANGNGGGQVMENALVNLDVTAPAATLALGLMFLKTNDAAAAAHVAVPSTHYALDHARPDFVLLRVVAKSLIMWDSIDPHEAWVEAQLPEILRLKKTSSRASPDAFEFQGEDDDGGHGGPTGAAVDREALAQAHVHALAGACMALGLRFAGTADAVAANTLTTYALTFLRCVLSHTGPHTTPSAW
jgi:anaphase-promoting complex subunit 1